MVEVRPVAETKETVTLKRDDFQALCERLEDQADHIIALEDELNDKSPPAMNSRCSTMDETMRIIEGESPIKVWREHRGMSVTKLADAIVGLHDVDLVALEKARRTRQQEHAPQDLRPAARANGHARPATGCALNPTSLFQTSAARCSPSAKRTYRTECVCRVLTGS